MIYLKTAEVAALLGVTPRSVQQKIQSNQWPSQKIGRGYSIPLSALPEDAQITYLKEHPDVTLTSGVIKELTTGAQLAASSRTITVGLSTNPKTEKQKRKIAIWQMMQNKPLNYKKTDWTVTVASMYSTSIQSVYRICTEIEEHGLSGITTPVKKLSSWNENAVQWLQGYYLKAIKEVGDCTKLSAYRALLLEAENHGWKIGNRSSAYDHLKALNPLLESYARGGNRELDNHFYILRDLDALRPMQIVVGDQHRFDWWVTDENGKMIRPECYLWIDMATRIPYGIAFDKKYNSSTVKMALYMGMRRFGRFECTYNDNGRPELSKAMGEIISDIQAYGMNNADISDLYKSDEGFIVTDDNDQIVSMAANPEEWKKQNRRIFAKVKNAKAKPIERFFRTFEQLLDDMALPGKIKNLRSTAAEEEEASKRLIRQEKQGYLLTHEEFIVKAIQALETYENRTHASLGMSPKDELMEKFHNGWNPVFINETECDFIFLSRIRRKVAKGRVLIESISYIGDDIATSDDGLINTSIGIHHLEGQSVEIRYNPYDLDKAFVIAPDGSIRPLYKSKVYEMLNDEHINQAMSWKKTQMKAVRDAYNHMTESIPGLVVKSEARKRITQAENKQNNTIPKISQKQLQEAVEQRKVDATTNIFKLRPTAWGSQADRYKWCLDSIIQGYSLSTPDSDFTQSYEKIMTDEDQRYWETYKTMGGIV